MFILPEPITLDTREEAARLAHWLFNRPRGWETRLAIDTETTGLSITQDFPLFWSLSDGKSRWFLDAIYLTDKTFDALFSDPNQVWCLANAKYDLHMMANFSSPTLRGPIYDIVGMGNMLDENLPQGLKAQSKRELGIDMKDFRTVFSLRSAKDVPRALMDPANREALVRYASLDAFATWHISEKLAPRLRNLPFFGDYSAFDYYTEIETAYTQCLWRIERRGMHVDVNVVDNIRPAFEDIVQNAKRDIWKRAGRPININSNAQLAELLFDQVGLKPLKFTPSGAPSLDKAALETYSKQGVPIVDSILKYRKYTKYIGTYLDGHLSKHLTKEHRIHSSLKQFGTVTGRLSSADPNMQNIPSNGPGLRLREAFTAADGFSLGVWDYSTLEMRVMAHMSSDVEMIKAIHSGLDIHCFTAAQMMNVDYSQAVAAKLADDHGLDHADLADMLSAKTDIPVCDARATIQSMDEGDVHVLIKARKAAKAVGFGVMFGLGPTRLADQLNVTSGDAKQRIAEWFSAFPGVKRFIDKAHRNVLTYPHEVRTISGRYRRLNDGGSPKRGLQAAAQRRAVNTPIQGSAGDIVKFAMLRIDQDPLLGGSRLEGGELGVRMTMQVHDELICEVPHGYEDLSESLIMNHMSNPGFDIKVPLAVEGGFGKNWRTAK